MSSRKGRCFWATIDRISKQGNGVVETDDGGHFIVGPVKEEAVSQTVRVRMVGPKEAELVDADLRKDIYAQSGEQDTPPLNTGDVLTGRLTKRTSDGVPVIERDGFRIQVPDAELNESVTIEITELLENTPSWKVARAKRVGEAETPTQSGSVIDEIELFDTVPTQPSERCQCPVADCPYSGAVASVAGHISGKRDTKHDWYELGYAGANQFKQETSGEQTHIRGTTSVLHVSDSHLGASLETPSEYSAANQCLVGFTKALDVGIERGVDAVMHTGDLFHNDKRGIPESVVEAVFDGLTRLQRSGIPCYAIEGNHERKEGRNVLAQLEQEGLVTRLSETPNRVGDGIELYGRDYSTAKEWKRGSWTPSHSHTDRIGILTMHQSVEPVSSSAYPECSISDVASMAKPHIQAVAAGHLHSYKIHWEDGMPFVFGDSTEPTRADTHTGPAVGCFHQREDSLHYQRISLQMGV